NAEETCGAHRLAVRRCQKVRLEFLYTESKDWGRRALMARGLTLELVFHPEALAFDDDRVSMMQQPIQDRGGQGAVMVEDRRPLLEGTVRGQDHRPLFIAEQLSWLSRAPCIFFSPGPPEFARASDASTHPLSEATRTADGWRLNGRKIFGTLSPA